MQAICKSRDQLDLLPAPLQLNNSGPNLFRNYLILEVMVLKGYIYTFLQSN